MDFKTPLLTYSREKLKRFNYILSENRVAIANYLILTYASKYITKQGTQFKQKPELCAQMATHALPLPALALHSDKWNEVGKSWVEKKAENFFLLR